MIQRTAVPFRLTQGRRILSLALFVLSILALPTLLYACIEGIPVLRMDGVYVKPDFLVGNELRDRAPGKYKVGIPVNFEFDGDKLLIAPHILKKSIFIWDFNDGTPPEKKMYGLTNAHTYAEEGGYLLQVSVDTTPAGIPAEPRLIQEVLVIAGDPPAFREKTFLTYGYTPWEEADKEKDSSSGNPLANILLGSATVILGGLTVKAVRKYK